MKIRLLSSLVVLAAGLIAALPSSAANISSEPAAYPVGTVQCFGNQTVQAGDTKLSVLRRLSVPTRKLSRDTWVYHNFSALPPAVTADDCATLVVNFKDGKVSNLTLVNQAAVTVIARSLPASATPANIAKN